MSMEIDAETKLSLGFALLAMVLGLAVDLLLNQSDVLAIAVVIAVGLVLPRFVAKLYL